VASHILTSKTHKKQKHSLPHFLRNYQSILRTSHPPPHYIENTPHSCISLPRTQSSQSQNNRTLVVRWMDEVKCRGTSPVEQHSNDFFIFSWYACWRNQQGSSCALLRCMSTVVQNLRCKGLAPDAVVFFIC
jgi:hypothetical protein